MAQTSNYAGTSGPAVVAKDAERSDLARSLAQQFVRAGAELIDLPLIQPAEDFLDAVGEDLRARTYVFTDLDGHELCLRPDLTIPVVRAFLADRANGDTTPRQYVYDGLVFRYRPPTANGANPREFRQVGLEFLGHSDPEPQIDALLFERVAKALSDAGLGHRDVRLGDLALMHAVLDGAPIPERWRTNLRASFAQPRAFKRLLRQLATDPAAWTKAFPADLLDGLDRLPAPAAEQHVERYLESIGTELVGTRSLTAMTDRLKTAAADRAAQPISAALAQAIDGLVNIGGSPSDAVDAFARMASAAGLSVTVAADAARSRHELLRAAGLDLASARFDCAFGRKITYYSGFVFEIAAPGLGKDNPIAGGGRYDHLVDILGADRPTPAAGAAIYIDRLLATGARAPATNATVRTVVTVAGRPLASPQHRVERSSPQPRSRPANISATGITGTRITGTRITADRLVLAVPSKGRMMDDCLALFDRAGLAIAKVGEARGYQGAIASLPGVDVAFVSASEIAERLKSGDVHLGVTGEDLARETAPDAAQHLAFRVRIGFGGADVVVAIPDAWVDVRTMSDLESAAHAFRRDEGRRLRVATKYRTLTRHFFAAHDVATYRIVDSLGATEGTPRSGAAEIIVDITSTGETLRANKLRILEDGIILKSEANLISALNAPRSAAIAALESTIIDKIAHELKA